VRMLRDCLFGLGLLAGSDHFGRLGLTRMHATVKGTRHSSIATRSTFASHTLTRGLLGGTLFEGSDFLAKLGDFGEEGLEIHAFGVGFGGSLGDLGLNFGVKLKSVV
jgi:hypothetical protein